MNEEQIKDMILKQCLELTTNNDFRPPISAYDGIDIDDVVRTCKQLQDKKTYLDLVKENQELKKENEEWKQHLKCAKEMLDIQGQKGNYNYDEYMLGLYNGMEYIISLFETREPNYISGKDIKFINNKTQQKEFIEYMNKTIEELEYDNVDDEEMKGYLIQRIDIFKEILSKYKEIIGVSDEKEN